MVDIKLKRSNTTGVVPSTLEEGVLAVNIPDKKLYVGNSSNLPVELTVASSGSTVYSNTLNYNFTNMFGFTANVADNNVTSSSRIFGNIYRFSVAPGYDENEMDDISLKFVPFSNGFSISITSNPGPVSGLYRVQYMVV